jgi:hypothetical protein
MILLSREIGAVYQYGKGFFGDTLQTAQALLCTASGCIFYLSENSMPAFMR